MDAGGAVVIALIAATFGGFVFIWTGVMGLLGRLPPSGRIGIRTTSTFDTPEAWYAAHRGGGAPLILGGVAIVAAGLSLVPFALAGKVDEVVVLAGTIGLVALHAATGLLAWVAATRAAREV